MITIGEAAKEIETKISKGKLILPYIANDKLIASTESFFSTINKLFKDDKIDKWYAWDFWKSGVDPFAIIASCMVSGKNKIEEHFQEVEVIRQRDKTISNAIGEFHQQILSSLEGCTNPGKGGEIDLIVDRPKLKLIAEIKNKWNTTKGDDKTQPYDKLKRRIESDFRGFTAYYVYIIPKPKKTNYSPRDTPFTPSHKGQKRESREDIREIDGKSFYALLTSRDDSLELLYKIFPKLIAYCMHRNNPQLADRKYIDEGDKYLKYLWSHIYIGEK